MEAYIYKGRQFSLVIKRVGKYFDWYYMDDNLKPHRNIDELAPTEAIAREEAINDIHAFIDELD